MKRVVEQWRSDDNINVLAFITDKCNYSCWYCYNRLKPKHADLNLNVLNKYVDFLHQNIDKKIQLDLIGGEPSCHPNLLDFTMNCTNAEMCIYTNLSQDINLYQRLQQNGMMFDITFHSMPYDEKNVGFMQNIKSIDANHIRGITVMLDKSHFDSNIQTYNELKRMFDGYDVDVDLQLVMIGDKCDSYSHTQLDIYNSLVENDKFKPFNVKFDDGSIAMVSHNQLYQLTKQKHYRWKCNAGLDLVYIHNTGDVYRCDGFYNFSISPEFNLNDGMRIIKTPTLCPMSNCPFEDNVHKWRIFK